MKNTNKILVCTAALLTASLLAACGSTPASTASNADTAPAESTESTAESTADEPAAAAKPAVDVSKVTLQDIREANDIQTLANTYGKIGMKQTSYGDDGSELFVINASLEQTGSNTRVNHATTIMLDGANETYDSALVRDGSISASFYYYRNNEDNSELKVMTAFSQADFYNFASTLMLPVENEQEVQSGDASLQDGILVVESVMDLRTQGGGIYTMDYYVDPDTLTLQSATSSYTDENGDYSGYLLYTYTYGDDVQTVALNTDVVGAILPADTADTCDVTVVFNYGQADEETQNYHVAKDVSVYASSEESPNMYTDSDLQNPVYNIDVSGDTATVYLSAN